MSAEKDQSLMILFRYFLLNVQSFLITLSLDFAEQSAFLSVLISFFPSNRNISPTKWDSKYYRIKNSRGHLLVESTESITCVIHSLLLFSLQHQIILCAWSKRKFSKDVCHVRQNVSLSICVWRDNSNTDIMLSGDLFLCLATQTFICLEDITQPETSLSPSNITLTGQKVYDLCLCLLVLTLKHHKPWWLQWRQKGKKCMIRERETWHPCPK